MDDLGIIEGIIRNSATLAKKKSFSYLNRLLPGLADEVVFICKKILSQTYIDPPAEVQDLNDEFLKATDHDVTGSPLRHSFGEDEFNVTLVPEIRNWLRDEESHFPLGKIQSSNILNLCIESLSDKWTLPIFVLSDGLDKEKIILLGAFVEPDWFSTMKICAIGSKECSTLDKSTLLMQEHCKVSPVHEREVKVLISSIYEFCGAEKTSLDWTENKRIDFEGYLSLELSWNTLSFLPPIRTTSNYLVAEIAAGWKGSALRELWDQLMLLDKYLTILENYQKKHRSSRYSVLPLQFPQDFDTPHLTNSETVMEKLNLLLSGSDAFEDENFASDDPSDNVNDPGDTVLLRSCLTELSSRQNLDFSDQLWQLVIGSSDYAGMTDCIHAVLEEIVENNYKPQINATDQTRIARIISDLNSQKAAVPSLAGSLPLELAIDMGMEKLSRDYAYLMLSASLADLHDTRQKLTVVSSGDFATEKYRNKLMTMAQIHICLEFLLLVQASFEHTLDTSHSLFSNALKLYTSEDSPVNSFADLSVNTIYTLKVPGNNAILKEIAKATPASWKGTLSSAHRASKFTTTTHCSRIPIFPPNIYSPDEPIEGEETFHVTKVVSCSYRTS